MPRVWAGVERMIWERFVQSNEAREAFRNDAMFNAIVEAVRAREPNEGDPVEYLGQLVAKYLVADRRRLIDAEIQRVMAAPPVRQYVAKA